MELSESQFKILNSGIWFSSREQTLQNELIQHASFVYLEAGKKLYSKGDLSDGLYVILEGSISFTTVSFCGKEAILNVLEASNWFGEVTLFDEKMRTHDTYAEENSILMHISLIHLKKMLKKNPVYWHDFGLLLTQRVRMLFSAFDDIALQPTHIRVARRLLIIATRQGEQEECLFFLKVSQEKLGMMLSLSRQTINQILRKFEKDHIIKLVRGGIKILDATQLKHIADSNY